MERLVFAAIDPLPTPLPTPLRCDVGSLTPAFVADNLAWMRGRAANSTEPYWRHVGFLLDQLDGMAAGYNAHLAAGAQPLSSEQLLLIQ